ncbi:hypothetical protein BDZ94DRAFT_96081 [Collybia nuda]|uniref:DUF6534 domain-containing protein n=1 Tax=Collybia nuda TaxID=64659 RepID=A0A9P5YE61_9AGAR|nr:hypothetical protein BDZ94DRAFT_96081 [Collybia nuda]
MTYKGTSMTQSVIKSALSKVMSIIERFAPGLLLTYLASWGFQGILCVQVYTYYAAFPRDRAFLKLLVYGAFILEILQTILMTKDALITFSIEKGTELALVRVRPPWFSVPILGGLVAFVGRMFFIYRLKVLSKSWVPTLPVMLFLALSAAGSIQVSIKMFTAGGLAGLFKSKDYIVALGILNTNSAICDIIIAGGVVYYLTRQETRFNQTHRRIANLIRLIVETGILTATMATLHLTLFVACKRTSYFLIPSMAAAKLYSNVMLLILNSRFTVAGGRGGQDIDTDGLYGIQDLSRWENNNDVQLERSIIRVENDTGFRRGTTSVEQSYLADKRPIWEITRPAESFQG